MPNGKSNGAGPYHYVYGEADGNHRLAYATVVISAVLVLAIAYFILHTKYSPAPANATGNASYGAAWRAAFLESFPLNSSLSNITIINNLTFYQGGPCSGTAAIKSAVSSSSATSQRGTDLSSLNPRFPFLQYAAIYTVNQSDASAYESAISNTGLCENSYTSLVPILSRSESSYSTIQFEGVTLHIYLISNLTADELNSTGYYFTGSKPDVYWYMATTSYGNSGLQFGSRGFVSSENVTSLIDMTKGFVSGFINAYNSNAKA